MGGDPSKSWSVGKGGFVASIPENLKIPVGDDGHTIMLQGGWAKLAKRPFISFWYAWKKGLKWRDQVLGIAQKLREWPRGGWGMVELGVRQDETEDSHFGKDDKMISSWNKVSTIKMNTGSRKRDLDEFEPAIHAQGASHGVAKRLRPGRCGKEGLMPTVVATNMKKHSFEEDKLNVPDRSEQEELDAINRRVESPVTSIDVDMMDVSIQEHIAVEQGGKEKFTHHVHFKYMDDSRLQKMLRSQALQQTHQQIRELFKIIHAPTSDQNPSKWLHDLLHSLLGFALAAERNPFCWHLTAAEQDEFRDIASDMVLIAATMPLEQRQRFPLKPLIDLNVLFKSMLGMEGLLDSFYILFDDSENCNNAFGLPNYPISES